MAVAHKVMTKPNKPSRNAPMWLALVAIVTGPLRPASNLSLDPTSSRQAVLTSQHIVSSCTSSRPELHTCTLELKYVASVVSITALSGSSPFVST